MSEQRKKMQEKKTQDLQKRITDATQTSKSGKGKRESARTGETVAELRNKHGVVAVQPASCYRKKSPARSECEERMVADHLPFLHSECRPIVRQDRRRDLHNMYTLLKPVDAGLPVLVREVQEHIARVGLDAVAGLTGDNIAQLFVDCVLEVHRSYSSMIRDVFNSDQAFTGALDMACAIIVNHRKHPRQQCRSPELLSRYCDSLLKRGAKGLSEAEIDDKLSQSITVFKYIDDKDVFQKFYAKMFAKRLIHTLSVSMDAEEGMINKLKNACGYEFTSKFHRMFTDIKLSDDLNDSFTQWIKEESSGQLGVSFNIFVLQAGAWPLGQAAISPFAVPQPLERPVSLFESFYNHKFSGRKLTWLHHLSTADVRLTIGSTAKRSYLVSMGTYHMAILHLFESQDSLSYSDLQEHTKLSEEQLVKHLQSLVDAKLVLTDCAGVPSASAAASAAASSPSTPVATAVGEAASVETSESTASGEKEEKTPSSVLLIPSSPSGDTMFHFNVNYSNKRTRFKITAVVQKEVQQVRLGGT